MHRDSPAEPAVLHQQLGAGDASTGLPARAVPHEQQVSQHSAKNQSHEFVPQVPLGVSVNATIRAGRGEQRRALYIADESVTSHRNGSAALGAARRRRKSIVYTTTSARGASSTTAHTMDIGIAHDSPIPQRTQLRHERRLHQQTPDVRQLLHRGHEEGNDHAAPGPGSKVGGEKATVERLMHAVEHAVASQRSVRVPV